MKKTEEKIDPDVMHFQLLKCKHCCPTVKAFLLQRVQEEKKFSPQAQLMAIDLLTKPKFADFAKKLLTTYIETCWAFNPKAELKLAELAKNQKYRETALYLLSLNHVLNSDTLCKLVASIDKIPEIKKFMLRQTEHSFSKEAIEKLYYMQKDGSKAAGEIIEAAKNSKVYLVQINCTDTLSSLESKEKYHWK